MLSKSLFDWLDTVPSGLRCFQMFLPQGEMPIEELMKMYSAAENESTDLQSDEESSQESSEEGIAELIALRFAINSRASDSLCLFVCCRVK